MAFIPTFPSPALLEGARLAHQGDVDTQTLCRAESFVRIPKCAHKSLLLQGTAPRGFPQGRTTELTLSQDQSPGAAPGLPALREDQVTKGQSGTGTLRGDKPFLKPLFKKPFLNPFLKTL